MAVHRTIYTTEDKLLMAQVIWQSGCGSWEDISFKLTEWSKERGKMIVMQPAECHYHYVHAMRQFAIMPANPAHHQRLLLPWAPVNLDLVKKLYLIRLQELHHEISQKEEAFRIITRDIENIRKGEWDGKIAREKVIPQTASSSSSQLSSIDSPVPPAVPPAQTSREVEARASHQMEVDDVDTTVRMEPEEADNEEGGLDMDDVLATSPIVETEKPTKTKQEKEEVEESSEESDGEGNEEEAPPARNLRNRKPAVEPLDIPASAAARRSKTQARKPSDTNTQASTRSKRRGAAESSKAAQSPTAGSVTGTLETAPTPAAAGTDENASVAEEESVRRRARGHKRKASEMDVDLPVVSKKPRERSSEEEPMTPAVVSRGGLANPRLRQSMTQVVTLLASSKHSEIFRKPVSKKEAPNYSEAVLGPVDLATIQRNIKAGRIGSWDELQRDLRRMLANCCVYNRPGTEAYETAQAMLEEVERTLESTKEGS